MPQGVFTLPAWRVEPKPCSTMKAGRFSPAPSPSGTEIVPVSFRPSEMKVMSCSAMIVRSSEIVSRARGRNRGDFGFGQYGRGEAASAAVLRVLFHVGARVVVDDAVRVAIFARLQAGCVLTGFARGAAALLAGVLLAWRAAAVALLVARRIV